MGDQIPFWLAFSYVPGVGSVRLSRLLDKFGDLERAWKANESALRGAGLGPKTTSAILRVRENLDLQKEHNRLITLGVQLITLHSASYPERLKQIQAPPAFLFILGELKSVDENAVAVVGTRQSSSYGVSVTRRLVRKLVTRGVTIISGLAKGIDGVAHRSTLDSKGRTIAVLGSGIDVIYPYEHRALAMEIKNQGAIISEYPPGVPPEGRHFPARNRIIAGLAKAVVVVEAAERSGALITAGFAAEQGKDVFAVPGDINRKVARGTNRLVQDGAHPLLEAQDIIDLLNLSDLEMRDQDILQANATEQERKVLEVMGQEPVHIDQLYSTTGLPIHEIQSALSMLELQGTIEHLGGMHYHRVRERPIRYNVD